MKETATEEAVPTSAPTTEPSPSPSKEFQFEEMVLVLRNNRAIISGAANTQDNGTRRRRELEESVVCDNLLMDLIGARIKSEIMSVISVFEVLEVKTTNVSKSSDDGGATLVFTFDVEVFIRSPLQEHNLPRYVVGAFDTATDREFMLGYLQADLGCPVFSSASSFELEVQQQFAAVSTDPEEAGGNPEITSQTILIAGTVSALAAGAILTAVFVFVRTVGRRNDQSSFSLEANVQEEEFQPRDHDVISEIGVQTAYEVSTLGDPLPLGHRRDTAPDEEAPHEDKTNESFSLDYDYQRPRSFKSYSDVSESEGTQTPHNLLVLSTDDDTFAGQYVAGEIFEVRAPPGILGLVLETTEDGVPVVNNIKPSSVLRNEVQVGDRLVSVDGIDVILMLATDVSQIIASKQNKAERLFIFSRPPIRKDSMSIGSLSQSLNSQSI